MLTRKLPDTMTPKLSHLYGTQSKTKVNSTSLMSSYEEEEHSGVIGNLFNHVATKLWR